MFIAIVSVESDGRVSKYQEFATRAEADAHVARFGGFVAAKPAGPWPDWKLNPAGNAIILDKRPELPPPPESNTTVAIKRLASAAGIDVSDLGLR